MTGSDEPRRGGSDGPGDGFDAGASFLHLSRELLSGDLLPRIRRCVEELPEEDLFWRPNDASNSVGNLLLHLAGNVRQWIVSGVGGAEDVRERDAEFSATGEVSAGEALAVLEEAVADVDAVLESLDPATLGESRTIQGRRVRVLGAVYHVVEHFSMHTGQIIWITKMRTGTDLEFWRVESGVARPNW